MLNRNFKPAFVVVFVLLVVLVFFILYNRWKNDLKENINFESIKSQQISQEDSLKDNIVNANNVISSIKSDTKIVLCTVDGKYYLSHDKTKKSNAIFEWFMTSRIDLVCDYSICFAIDTSSLNFSVQDGTVWVYFSEDDIYINSLTVHNSVSDEITALFGSKYSSSEVLALEQIIKENIQSDAMMKRENIILAKANLIVYLSNLAESFNAEIVICEQ